jgi:hypothetical protein
MIQPTMGGTRNACVNVSERYQMVTMPTAVGQYTSSTAASTSGERQQRL